MFKKNGFRAVFFILRNDYVLYFLEDGRFHIEVVYGVDYDLPIYINYSDVFYHLVLFLQSEILYMKIIFD